MLAESLSTVDLFTAIPEVERSPLVPDSVTVKSARCNDFDSANFVGSRGQLNRCLSPSSGKILSVTQISVQYRQFPGFQKDR